MLANEKNESIEVFLSNRLFLYSLFHKVFGREPDHELLDILTGEIACDAFGILSEEANDDMARCVCFLRRLRTEFTTNGFTDKVKSEYTHLFLGPGALPAPPWESVYRSRQGLLFQESTLEVRKFYRAFHMLPEGYPSVADDSLALELDFMSHLAEKSLMFFHSEDFASTVYYLRGQNQFLQEHLLLWTPRFLEKMADVQSGLLYPQMSQVLVNFLKKDQKGLENLFIGEGAETCINKIQGGM